MSLRDALDILAKYDYLPQVPRFVEEMNNILKLQEQYGEDYFKLRHECVKNCTTSGGIVYDDYKDIQLGRDTLAFYIEPLDLYMTFPSQTQYYSFLTKDERLTYDRKKMGILTVGVLL